MRFGIPGISELFLAPKTILVGNAQGKSNLLEGGCWRHCDHTGWHDRLGPGKKRGQINATIERQTGFSDLSLTLRRNGRHSCPQ